MVAPSVRQPRQIKRSNVPLRLLALAISVAAFAGFYQAAAHSGKGATNQPAATPASGDAFEPPTPVAGGIIPPGSLGRPHGGTKLS